MMKTLRNLILLTIVLATSFSFTACSSDDDGVAPEPKTEKTLSTVILGNWFVEDLGTAIFKNEGKCRIPFKKEETGKEEIVDATYEIEGNKLTITYLNEPFFKINVISFDNETIVYKKDDGPICFCYKLN